MDVSSSTPGISYEAEFIIDLELAARLVLIHDETVSARVRAEQLVERLLAAGRNVPVVPYTVWRTCRLKRDLRKIARRRMRG